MKKIYKKILLVLIIAAAITIVRVTGLNMIFSFEQLGLYKDQLAGLVSEHYIFSVVIYIISYIIITALSIPGATVLTLAGGFFFGLAGVIYVNIGATTGAVFAFLTARYVLGSWIQARYKDRLISFNREMDLHGYNYMLTLRFIPAFPFFLINIMAGISAMPLRTFIWTTAVGIIPGSFVYIYAGTQAGAIEKAGDIFSCRVLIAFGLLAFISLMPVFIGKIIHGKQKKGAF